MDELLIILEPEPVFMVTLDGNQGIADPPDPYEIAVAHGYIGTKTQWLNSLFERYQPINIDPNLPDFVEHWLSVGG